MPKNPYYTFLEIKGTLKAEGTSSEKIVFTSEKDADYGGAGGADKGDMKNIIFTSTSTNSVLDYVLFRYGGRSDVNFSRNGETIRVDNSSIEIKNSTIEYSYGNGVRLINSNSIIENTTINDNWIGIYVDSGDTSKIKNNQIRDNFYHGIEISAGVKSEIKNNIFTNGSNYAIYTKSAGVEFSGNSVVNNPINGICVSDWTVLSEDAMWSADLPYVIESNAGSYFTINEGVTLTLDPGVIIKPTSQYYNFMVVEGTLKAEGALGNEIIFTSLNDDSFGGDTNNDGGATIPQMGDWKQIDFKSTSIGSVFDYVKMYYGTGDPPIAEETSGSVEIKDTADIGPKVPI
jgi:parallel beta-helix repeat protein